MGSAQTLVMPSCDVASRHLEQAEQKEAARLQLVEVLALGRRGARGVSVHKNGWGEAKWIRR